MLIARWSVGLAGHVLAVVLFQSLAMADTFHLRDGRVLTGKLVRVRPVPADDSGKSGADLQLIVELDAGFDLLIYKSDILAAQWNPAWEQGKGSADSRVEEYEKRAGSIPDQAQAHYAEAQQLKGQGLDDLAAAHFRRALDFDPNQRLARVAVGHTESNTGRWIKVKEKMSGLGKVQVGSRWVYPEHLAQDDQQDQRSSAKNSLKATINRWHGEAVQGGAKSAQALASLGRIDDPMAVEVIAPYVADQKLRDPIRRLYVDVLSRFEDVRAYRTLAVASVEDSNASIRIAAIDALTKRGRAVAIPIISRYLNPKPTSSNDLVNQAAFALGKLNATEVILELIGALVTKHEIANNAPGMNVSGSGGLSMGGPKKITVERKNEQVLSALSQLTGQGGLGYDRAAWLAWFADRFAPPVGDLRRDL